MKSKPFWTLAVMVLIGLGWAAMPMQAAEREQLPAFSEVDKDKNGSISTDESAAVPGLCEQWGQSDQLGIPQGKSESPLATWSMATWSGPSVNDEFVGVAEIAMDDLKNGIEALKAASGEVSPDIQAALDEQIDVLQEQQQVAGQTLDELKRASGEVQPHLQAHFISIWDEIATSYEAAELLLILDAMGTGWVLA